MLARPSAALDGCARLCRGQSARKARDARTCPRFDLPQTGFYHGNAAVAGRVLLFFYFKTADAGLMALIPGVKGGSEVARFRVTGDLAGNPKHN